MSNNGLIRFKRFTSQFTGNLWKLIFFYLHLIRHAYVQILLWLMCKIFDGELNKSLVLGPCLFSICYPAVLHAAGGSCSVLENASGEPPCTRACPRVSKKLNPKRLILGPCQKLLGGKKTSISNHSQKNSC